MPLSTVKMRRTRSPVAAWRRSVVTMSDPRNESDEQIDEENPGEGRYDAAQAVDQPVAAQQVRRAGRGVAHAAQGQRDERDDDQRVEDDGREDGRLRCGQAHDVERAERRVE